MIDKFNKHKSVSGRCAMSAGDKKETASVKKVALRELSNESGNIINRRPENFILKEKGQDPDLIKVFVPDSARLAGSKRKQSDGPASPSSSQMPGKILSHGNLVYVRRRLETEQAKTGASVDANKDESSESRTPEGVVIVEPNPDLNKIQEPKTATSGGLSDLNSCEKTNSGFVVSEPHDSSVISETPVIDDSLTANNQDQGERFLQLQMFLRSCNQSSQEDYMQMLRSLSAAGRSKHAVELEKRAIHLLLEEGKELHRMKVLNVLGKASQQDHAMRPAHTSSSL
ncbi:hypothetical protein MUK42_32584 [Musa troglodytarum]|uniref:Uncharacterized protein n=1 Tax=Musa troglodytarum TaxID=320322 RepID=A0A9E7JUC4_9LILI|nr:hypothetical protein MUK42_32584 [Musa troglodytarum]URD93945.1 hypothetical protein MUK42_32584 [Musa troglodytarum]